MRIFGYRCRPCRCNLNLCLSIVAVVLVAHYSLFGGGRARQICIRDAVRQTLICRPCCGSGDFSLPGMERCRPWLTCDDIDSDVMLMEEIGRGLVKMVHRAEWHGRNIAVSILRASIHQPDFEHGVAMLTRLQPDPRVVQLIGSCSETGTLVSEFHAHRSADNLNSLLGENPTLDLPATRFRLCINYVEILSLLHDVNGPVGKRVMCDSNDLLKTLQQFLVTSNLRLLVNDLDALPEIRRDSPTVKCGRREIVGNSVAPEQLWPYDDREFDDELMPGYDEKTDIWKIPDVCAFFLAENPGCRAVAYRLFRVHNRCKERDPALRPTAGEVLAVYRTVWDEFALS